MDHSVRIWHDKCYDAFGALLNAASSTGRYADQLPHHVLVDLFGHFNVWAGNIGAGQDGRASLDYRLREAQYIKEAVIRTLKHLSEAIQDANSIVTGTRVPFDEVPSDSESSASSSSDDLKHDKSDGLSLDTEGADQSLPNTELSQVQHAISSFIRNLFQISIIVRKKPAPHDRLIKAAKIDTSFYEFFDIRHVQEKYPLADQDLVRRLGIAISKRRKYFKYREQHRQKLSASQSNLQIKDPVASKSTILDDQSKSQIAKSQKGQATGEETLSLRQSTTVKESTTASTFVPLPSQTPLNLGINEQQSDTATQTTYESTTSLAQDRFRTPDLYRVSKGAREFECPYCYTIIRLRSDEQKKQEREWKKHVLRDLQPYICTFIDCPNGNTPYERRAEWIRHEVRYHRREWYCNATGHEIYKIRTEFEAHMVNQHKGSFAMDQLKSVIDMLERPAISSRFSCPLCCDDRYEDLNVEQLEKHLGYHLEVTASFALPSITGGTHASDDSVAAQDARHDDHDSSWSDLDIDRDTPHVDIDLDEEEGTVNDIMASSLHDLDVFKSQYGQRLVSRRFADHCRQSWLKTAPELLLGSVKDGPWYEMRSDEVYALISAWNVSLSSLSKPGYEDGTSVAMIELLDDVSDFSMLQESSADRAGIIELRRYYMKIFVDFMVTEIVSQGEQVGDMFDGLQQLQTQLSISMLPEAAVDSDQDWGFMHTQQSPPKAFVEAEAQEERDSVEEFCHWLWPIDQYLSLSATEICPGTCNWLEETSEYKQFKDGAIRVLLLQGYPGIGKTTLFANTIRELKLEADLDDSLGLAYYFLGCGSDSPLEIFRTLVCQLVNQARSVPSKLQAVFRDSPDSSHLLSRTRLEEMLEEAMPLFKKTIFAIDALDQIDVSLIQVISRFVRRMSNCGVEVQLIAFSRTNMAIEDAFWDPTFVSNGEERSRWMNTFKKLHIDPQMTAKDIRIYAMSSISRKRMLLADRVFQQIVLDSEGLFIVAASRIHMIESCESEREMMEAFSKGPHPADAAWRETLLRIMAKADNEDIKRIHSILEMLCVCERNMNAEEIHGNLRHGSIAAQDKYDVWRHNVSALCELAVRTSGDRDDRFGLIHGSIKRFLQSGSLHPAILERVAVDPIQAQRVITQRCLAELLKFRNADLYRSKYGWTAYAGAYWHSHAKKLLITGHSSHDVTIWRDCTQLLRADTASFAHWIYMTRQRGHYDQDERGDFGKKDTYPSPLYYAALLGLLPSAQMLIENGEDVNVKGGKYQFPILAAVESGESDIVRLLLKRGADGNSRNEDGEPALIRAIQREDKEIVHVLVAAGVDLNIRNEYGETAAHLAAIHESDDCLQILQEGGANLDLSNSVGRTPLHFAVDHERLHNTMVLLNAGADLEAIDQEGFTPLLNAAWGGFKDMLEVLLQLGASVNATAKNGETPLHFAAREDTAVMVRLLLSHGADPSMRDGDGDLPEDQAPEPEIKRLLQESRISVEQTAEEVKPGELTPRRQMSRMLDEFEKADKEIQKSGKAPKATDEDAAIL